MLLFTCVLTSTVSSDDLLSLMRGSTTGTEAKIDFAPEVLREFIAMMVPVLYAACETADDAK